MTTTEKAKTEAAVQMGALDAQIKKAKGKLAHLKEAKAKLARGTQDNLSAPTGAVQVHNVRPPQRFRGKYTILLGLASAPLYTAEVVPGTYTGAIAAVNRFKDSGRLTGDYSVIEGPTVLPGVTEEDTQVEVPEGFVAVIKLK